MRMMPIASGSSGNCIYLGTEDTHVLFDAGISRKRIEEGLNTAGSVLYREKMGFQSIQRLVQ